MQINKCKDCNNESCPDSLSEEDKQKLFQKKVHFFIISTLILLMILLI